VAQGKRNVFRKIWTWESWESRSKLAPAGMRMTRSAKWHDPGSRGFRNKEKTTLHREPGKEEKKRIDIARARNAKMA
jgi:hypothetical protein